MVLTPRLSSLLRRAGIEGARPCNGWRHTAATMLLDSGANIKVVQTKLGYASPSITLST